MSSSDFNNVSFFQNQLAVAPNAITHNPEKPLAKLRRNTKLVECMALGALALLTVVGGSLAAKTLWFNQAMGPSNNSDVGKVNNIFNHLDNTCPATCELPFFPSCNNLSSAPNEICSLDFYNKVMMSVAQTGQNQTTNHNITVNATFCESNRSRNSIEGTRKEFTYELDKQLQKQPVNKQKTVSSEEVFIIALKDFNQGSYWEIEKNPALEKQIIDLIFSNIELLEKKHNELLAQAILKLISDSLNHKNIDYILNEYGIEKFLKHFSKILTSEFLTQYHSLTKKLIFNCLDCQAVESEEFLTKTLNLIKDTKSYLIFEVALACADSEENYCKEFILGILPQFLQDKTAFDLVEKCAKTDTDACNIVIQKALEPILTNNADPFFYSLFYPICIGSKTKSCIDLLPRVFAAVTESEKKHIEFYCNLEKNPLPRVVFGKKHIEFYFDHEKKPQLPGLSSSVTSLALTQQTACDRLYGSKEFQDFKNPSLMTRFQHILPF